MSKQPGYSVRITCFIPASSTDMEAMRLAISAIEAQCEAMRREGFRMVTHKTRFMLSREVPDEPKGVDTKAEAAEKLALEAAEQAANSQLRQMGLRPNDSIAGQMPPIPAALRRS